MCGIVGWVNLKAELKDSDGIIQSMADTLYWRGPDSSGKWLTDHVAFGHRRLIVVDPKGGIQPMMRMHNNKNYVLIYNGELYNTDEVRQKLISRGHTFASHSDTEVLLVSYIEWGENCVDHLNGIFAFAVWDEYNRHVFAARDRLGVKPLFYTLNEDGLVFASELKALMAHPSTKPVVKRDGLAEILLIGPGRTPGHGVFEGVNELKPGFSLIYSDKGVRTSQYWRLKSFKHEDDLQTTLNNVKQLVFDAVERQLVADVPVCTLLSGGLDSSIISGIAAKVHANRKQQLHTYSVDFLHNDVHFKPNEFQPNSDLYWIEQMTSHFNTVHHQVMIDTPQLLSSLEEAVIARDLPGMTDIDSSLYLFSQEIRKDAIVALSGECADEVFGGYPWFYREEALTGKTFAWSRNIADRTTLLCNDIVEAINPESYIKQRYEEALDEIPLLNGENEADANIRKMFYLNLTRWMPTLLDRKDRMTMRASLEVRVPFCDHRLVEYAWNIPWHMKNLNGREKGLLRAAVKGLLPEEVLWRKKSPYPKTHNPDYFKAVRDGMIELLNDPHSPIHLLFDTKKLKQFATNCTPETHFPWFGQLMNTPQLFAYVYSINYWMKHFKVEFR